MGDVKWIKIVPEIFDNRKIKQIEKMPEGDAIIVVWFKLLCLAGTCNKNGMIYLTDEIPYTEEMLAAEFRMEQQQRFNVLKLALTTFVNFKMIEVIDNVFYISSWDRYQNVEGLEKIREQNRIRQARFKENQKLLQDNVIGNVTNNGEVTHSNATDKEKEIDKDIYKNTVQCDCTAKVSKSEIDDFFESVWKLYPNKKGKGQVSDARKKKLYNIGFSQLSLAISRFQEELKKDSWRQAQNGSTFFNSGYIDYLDGNYQPGSTKPQQPQPKAKPQTNLDKYNSYPQRNYTSQDYAVLEKKLTNKGLYPNG